MLSLTSSTLRSKANDEHGVVNSTVAIASEDATGIMVQRIGHAHHHCIGPILLHRSFEIIQVGVVDRIDIGVIVDAGHFVLLFGVVAWLVLG